MQVKKRDGRLEEVRLEKITQRIDSLSKDLNIEPIIVSQQVVSGLYDKVTTKELDDLAVKTAANLATSHPDYDKLAARISISMLHKETTASFSDTMEKLYSRIDKNGNKRPFVTGEYIDLVRKHKKAINAAIVYNRDYLFDYLGIETLKRSYLAKINGSIVERPQHMWMRVALGIHGNDISAAFETYNCMSQKFFTHATPTLFNSGTAKNSMISCFLLEIDDDSICGDKSNIDKGVPRGIFKTVFDCARISQLAGGIGVHIHKIRSAGAPIYGTGGVSNGLVPMLKVFDSTANYVDQGGSKRKGSFAFYLNPAHPDLFEWLDLKKNQGKDEIRSRNLFYGLWVSDLFMRRVKEDGNWTFMDPMICPGLEDVWGEDYEALYKKYEDEERGQRTVKARDVWRKILETQIETSMPYILYKDACNRKSNQKNIATIKSSNLCCEIIEVSTPEETASCNLGSLALPMYINSDKTFNHRKLHDNAKIIIKNLNKVIDVNFYPIPEAKNSNMRHRPIGLGIQGLADVFMTLGVNWDSQEAFELNKEIFETIYHGALEASVELSKEFGPYSTYEGSPASRGELQYDMYFSEIKEKWHKEIKDKVFFKWQDPWLFKTAEDYFCSDRYDWRDLKKRILKHGLRNSLLIALMPTASTASILGNTESFEPVTTNIYKRNVLSGEFIRINKHLVKDLQEINLWNDQIKQRIIANEGSIQAIDEIPENLKKLYRTVWELSQKPLIELSAARGAFVCQSQSFNLYIKNPDFGKLTSALFHGWSMGLKTGSYYIRQKSVRQAQKFTVDANIEKSTLGNDEGDYQQGLKILQDKGFSQEEIDKMDRKAVISMAAELCSLDDPEGCIMCSG